MGGFFLVFFFFFFLFWNWLEGGHAREAVVGIYATAAFSSLHQGSDVLRS